MTPSARYTHGHHGSVLASHTRRTAENSAGYLLEHLEAGMTLLDVGCGPGTITSDLAHIVAPGAVIGIDSSAEIIEEATRRLHAARATNASAKVGDIASLAFEDDSFDIVHAHQVLQHLADPVGALVEMHRVAKPGGIVAARDADYQAMTFFPELDELISWRDLYRRLARANGAEPDAGRRLLSWARAAGFTEITTTTSTWCYATPEEREWWGSSWAERIVSSAIAQQALEGGEATREELQALAAGWRRWAATEDGLFVVLNTEICCAA